MRITRSAVVVDGVGAEELAVLLKDLDRLARRLRFAERVVERRSRPAAAVDGDDLHPRSQAGFRGGESENDIADRAAVFLQREAERAAVVVNLAALLVHDDDVVRRVVLDALPR